MGMLATRMADATRAFVTKANAAIHARLDELALQLQAIPAGPAGKDGESITGPEGKPGKDGESITGPAGKDGESLHPDTVALMINKAVADAVAAIELPAANHGRDAAQIEPLPRIDEARSYAPGTWASHAGGLIRASRQTDPIKDQATDSLTAAGWVVMVDGLAAVLVTQAEDPRDIVISTLTTSAIQAAVTLRVPMVIDKGVWREGNYEQGDHVSADGSGWIAQRASADRPGTSDAWRLSTKRGRDGKDGGIKATAAPAVVRLK